jgi:uncharacterized protein (DUF1684 family)
MNKKVFFFLVGLAIIVIVIYNFWQANPTSAGYIEEIESHREEIDRRFKASDQSPLADDQLESFESLSYFPVSEKYRVFADLQKSNTEKIITMAITDGSNREYYVYGNAHFHLDGKELDLLVYRPVRKDSEYLFMPFYDKTSADITYGGGRYVEPEELTNGRLLIDFNLAYNPYCAYNATYRCPIPPRENSLDVRILAGEKAPEFDH